MWPPAGKVKNTQRSNCVGVAFFVSVTLSCQGKSALIRSEAASAAVVWWHEQMKFLKWMSHNASNKLHRNLKIIIQSCDVLYNKAAMPLAEHA